MLKDRHGTSEDVIPMDSQIPVFFETPIAMRAWLRKHHATAKELLVGFCKAHAVTADTPSITWPESVAEALCFGWIDGVRKSLDKDRYTIRFSPRRPGSKWSAVNIRLMAELEAAGKVTDAGRAAFVPRSAGGSRVYSYEQKGAREAILDAALEREFKKNRGAWAFFQAQPPSYRKKALWWVMSAKQGDAKERRFRRLLAASAVRTRLG